jgi:hypothetical protein
MIRPPAARLLAFLAFLAFALPPALPAQAAAPPNVVGYSASNLSGQWQGVFFSAGLVTPFNAFIIDDGGAITGSITEINGFGDQSAAFLLADLQGTVRNGRISFEKTYNGVGGQTHTVRYQGTVSRDGRRITGTWSLDGQGDQFEMAR